MRVRSFHSVFMASVVAGAALGCYLVSLRVASERAALQSVESEIALAQRDIRLLQTEIGTRARLAQLERWNVRVLALSAPSADQILGDKFQLARLVRPEQKPAVEAPVVLASAPAVPRRLQPEVETAATGGQLLHEAGLTLPGRAATKPAVPNAADSKPAAIKIAATKPAETKVSGEAKKAGDKTVKQPTAAVTRPVRTAKVDPLAPLPVSGSTAKASRTNR
jgi:hypothetical protein